MYTVRAAAGVRRVRPFPAQGPGRRVELLPSEGATGLGARRGLTGHREAEEQGCDGRATAATTASSSQGRGLGTLLPPSGQGRSGTLSPGRRTSARPPLLLQAGLKRQECLPSF